MSASVITAAEQSFTQARYPPVRRSPRRAYPALVRVGGAFLLVVLLACSDAPRDADAATDGGPDAGDAGVDAAPPIDPPQPPALPRLDPCPAGWRRVDGEIAV